MQVDAAIAVEVVGMRETSIRWGLGTGIAATVTGVLAIFLGTIFEPTTRFPDAIAVATALFVRGILILISLGLALSFCYYAGLRIEQAHAPSLLAGQFGAAQAVPGAAVAGPSSQFEAGLAGGIAVAAYWAITTLYLWVLLPSGSRVPLGTFVVSRLLFGVLCILLGAGMGAIGARGALARRALLAMTIQRTQAPALAVSAATPPPATGSEPHETNQASDTTAPLEPPALPVD